MSGGVGVPVYPMPAPADDARFTFGLVLSVADLLAARGFPPVDTGADLVRLQLALFRFLYESREVSPDDV